MMSRRQLTALSSVTPNNNGSLRPQITQNL